MLKVPADGEDPIAMTLNIDTEQPVLGPRNQRALIKAVLAASNADETRWLEWKSSLDLSKPEGAFAVSKAILGFANRMPDVAEQWAGGHAYLLVGVEEGALHGIEMHDIEKVDAWLTRYIGDFDRYQFTYVPIDEGDGLKQVMLVDVFPPRWGDPIHPLRKDYDKAYSGTVFHRYAGRTQPARAAEIDALTERARRASQRTNVEVRAIAGTVALVPETEDQREGVVDYFRGELMKQLDVPRSRGNAFLGNFSTDPRSPKEFEVEVEEYLRDLATAMNQALVHQFSTAGTPLRLKMTNPGEENLTKVEVVLSLPDAVLADVVDSDVDWPYRPTPYGTALSPGLMAGFRQAAFIPKGIESTEVTQHEGRTIIRFVPVDLRPHETVFLDPITLYSTEEGVEAFAGEWRATATNVSGKVQQHLSIPAQRLEIELANAWQPLLGDEE
ncbi:AlbA family DNA-binding domain-containing protein [[Kitasatospora] papulosa]